MLRQKFTSFETLQEEEFPKGWMGAMFARTLFTAIALCGAICQAQAADAPPKFQPDEIPDISTSQPTSNTVHLADFGNDPRWRYRWHDNHWWYWTPGKSWMIYQNNAWVPYGNPTYYS